MIFNKKYMQTYCILLIFISIYSAENKNKLIRKKVVFSIKDDFGNYKDKEFIFETCDLVDLLPEVQKSLYDFFKEEMQSSGFPAVQDPFDNAKNMSNFHILTSKRALYIKNTPDRIIKGVKENLNDLVKNSRKIIYILRDIDDGKMVSAVLIKKSFFEGDTLHEGDMVVDDVTLGVTKKEFQRRGLQKAFLKEIFISEIMNFFYTKNNARIFKITTLTINFRQGISQMIDYCKELVAQLNLNNINKDFLLKFYVEKENLINRLLTSATTFSKDAETFTLIFKKVEKKLKTKNILRPKL
jgi:hypothetical protein